MAGRRACFMSFSRRASASLLTIPLPACLRPVHAAELDIVMEDFRIGKDTVVCVLALKTTYLQQLPILFAGLEAVDEEEARSIAIRIKAAWDTDPREVVHHRVTWSLMKIGTTFAAELDKFIDGFCDVLLASRLLA